MFRSRSILCFIAVMLCCVSFASAPRYVRGNESSIFSFTTTDRKHVEVAIDTSGTYIVYRYGTASRIELEYPARDTNSWRKMAFYRYMRPAQNGEGLDLNNLSFKVDTCRYVVCQNWSELGQQEIGVMVLTLNGKKLADHKAIRKSVKGSLMDLNTYVDMMQEGMEEYEE